MREALCLVWLSVGGLFAQRCGDTPLLRMSTATSANGNTNGNRTDFGVATKDGQHFYFRTLTAVYLHCTANRPIHFKVTTVVASPVDEVYFSRDVVDLFNSNTYCYNATFRAGPSFEVTGKYTCSVIQDRTVSTSVFLFINSENGTVLLNDGLQTLVPGVPDNSGWITLPCVATSPAATPIISPVKLLRRSSTVKALQLKEDAVLYIPGIGFRLKALVPPAHCCSREYICELKQNGEDILQDSSTTIILHKTQAFRGKVFSRVDPSDYVLGHNTGTETKRRVLQYSHSTLSCESNVPVTLEVKGKHIFEHFKLQFSTNPNSFYEHKVILSGTAREVREMEVSCKTVATPQLLHKWSLTTVSPRAFYPTAGIHFVHGKRYHPITCYSSTEKGPSIAIVRCDDVINCAIAQSFAHDILKPVESDQRKFPYQVISGHPFCVKERDGPSTLGCAELSPWSRRGIVTCYEEQSDQKVVYAPKSFMTGLNDTIVELPEHAWEEAGRGTNDISVLELSTGSDVLYVDEVLTVGCNASYGVFSMGIQFIFQLKNHTNLTILDFGSLGFVEHLEKDVITYKGQVKIEDEQIQRIWCFAPIWNSANWRRVYRDITVQVGHRSVITNESMVDHVRLSIGEEGRFLACEVIGGEPDPVIRWTIDGEEVTKANHKVKLIEQNATTTGNITVLWFSDIVGAHAGNYSCEAFNVKGLAVKQFSVEVAGGQSNTPSVLIAITLSSLVLIASISTAVFFFVKYKKNNDGIKVAKAEIYEFKLGQFPPTTAKSEDTSDIEQHTYSQPYDVAYELDLNDLLIQQDFVLGQGQFGIVYKGLVQERGKLELAAFKTTRPSKDKESVRRGLQSLLRELKLMIYIGHHPNITRLIGANTAQLKRGIAYIVIEYCSKGSLEMLLRGSKHSTTSDNATNHDENTETVTPTMQCDWALQIARGMEYLAQKKVIHSDLACRNVLVTSDFSIRINDFGLSRRLENYSNYVKSGTEPLPWRWMAPESLECRNFSTQSDVWSYGVTLWEIYSMGSTPYSGQIWSKDFVQQLKRAEFLEHPEHTPDEIYDIMKKCWALETSKRPNFEELARFFQEISYKNHNIVYI